ncbi:MULTISPECIES: 5-oxoprolinase subunit B family protein [Streptomyces]|uniref:Allophanate hydrolase subunit 1 n=1 Tax=Streptomyces chilikensis TaxID=1194079 RepID=A0ABV3ER22_9ACTN|nr:MULTISPECIES: allophanate hydrolase subunit 1 [Streptomyces]MDH6226938.1 allophanate hydrolase subunit 1 [Streptomyces sp. MJP52]
MRFLPCGDQGLLVEVGSLEEALGLYRSLEREPPPGVTDLVPAARTVLLRLAPGADPARVEQDVRGRDPVSAGREPGPPVRVPVHYDGEDLDEVAELTGLSAAEVVRLHTGCEWTVAFGGFAPGFAYLTGGPRALRVPRRTESRTRVPAGAVGLAGEFSGVYPRSSPGGWRLIGRTELAMWREDRDPPALLRPGARVRFEEVGRS